MCKFSLLVFCTLGAVLLAQDVGIGSDVELVTCRNDIPGHDQVKKSAFTLRVPGGSKAAVPEFADLPRPTGCASGSMIHSGLARPGSPCGLSPTSSSPEGSADDAR